MLIDKTKTDTTTVKQSIDLRVWAARYTTLHRESTRELAGPCPKCGGDDRFHVTVDRFMCRQCHPQWEDAIKFVRWLDGCSFKEAIVKLDGSITSMQVTHRHLPQSVAQKTQAPLPLEWLEKATRIADTAHERLISPAGQRGAAYLQGRGLQRPVWERFKLGYRDNVGLPGTWDSSFKHYTQSPQPAIVIPWHDEAGQVKAIRYRFLQQHDYIDIGGQRRQSKQKSESGSQLTGQLYGYPGLLRGCEQWLTLLICEGELNALSIWQAQHDAHLDVLSLGSESQRLTPAMLALAQQYKRVIVWADKNDVAWKLRQQVQGAHAVKSPNGADANDLLQNGQLGTLLVGIRFELAKTDDEKEGLLWDLRDARLGDAGTQSAIAHIARHLGKSVQAHA